MTTMMSDLSDDLVEEILSKVPLTSLGAVRCTCKRWNDLSKDRVLCKAESRQQFLGFMKKDYRFCSLRFDLHGIQNEDVEFVEPSIKQIDKFSQVEIVQVFHCDGLLLLLLVTKEDNTRLVVWNPYLAQTRWIQPRNSYESLYICAFGYDNNHNHKILMLKVEDFEIFDFKSNSWRDFDVILDWRRMHTQYNVSLKGNSYFIARGDKIGKGPSVVTEIDQDCLLCFDFSTERFGPCLPFPFHFDNDDTVVLSSTREEQVSVLYKPWNTTELKIWVTTKIDSNAVSWSNFLTIDITPFYVMDFGGSFFIDQEKKLALLYDICIYNGCRACIIGENGYLREVDLGKIISWDCQPLVCSYAPSLVQISQGPQPSPIRRDY